MQRYRDVLEGWSDRGAAVAVLPVASNVGELSAPPPGTARVRRMVLWGSARARERALRHCRKAIEAAVAALDLREIVTVGAGPAHGPGRLGGAATEHAGLLPAPELGRLLEETLIGAFGYDPDFLAKSTVFAALCAHGVAPLCLPTHSPGNRARDGIQPGTHFLLGVEAHNGFEQVTRVAREASRWYATHTLAKHAELIGRLIGGAADAGP
jgi:hypothetical protein